MIAKIRTGAYFKGALLYNENKVEKGEAYILHTSNLAGDTQKEIIAEFKEINKLCPNVSKPVFHTSLNFAQGENIDQITLQAIVDEYMEKLGYRNSPYIVYEHKDTSHQHVHIVGINIHKVDGKYRKIDDSFQYKRSEKISRGIELEYHLMTPEQSKSKRERVVEKENQEIYHTPDSIYDKDSVFDYLKNRLDSILPKHNFSTIDLLNEELKKYRIMCNKIVKSNYHYYNFTMLDKDGRRTNISATLNKLGTKFTEKELKAKLSNKRTFTQDDYTRIAKELTNYRRENKIFHESTLWKNESLVQQFRQHHLNDNIHNSIAIIDYFIDYKKINLHKIEFKEHIKNINFINKSLEYFNALGVNKDSYNALLSLQGIDLGTDKFAVSNKMDRVVQYVNLSECNNVQFGSNNKIEQIKILNENEIKLICDVVNGRAKNLDFTNVNLERVREFMPTKVFNNVRTQHNAQNVANYLERRKTTTNTGDFIFSNGGINLSGLFGRPTDDGVMRKKKKSDDDEEEEERRKGRGV